jgi:hypothetical protein
VGETNPPPELQLSLVWRDGSYSIDAPRNADLVLRIANARDLADVADGGIWSLTLRRKSGQAIFRTSSLGLPPASVTVPSTAFADPELSVLAVTLLDAVLEISYDTRSETSHPTFNGGGLDYVAELRITANLYWTLSLTGPAN